MKPDWDKLIKEYKDSKDILIADVDCTAGGKELCEEVGVQGYPTIKHGDPNDLEDYEGGRSLKDLKKFASTLGPKCGPANLDLCDDAKKTRISELIAMSAEDREKLITEGDAKIKQVSADFDKFVEGLQKSYEEASKKKDADIAAVKDSGLGLIKSVHAHTKKAKTEL